jgi:hypothetical protein
MGIALIILSLVAGCSTSFKYTPQYDQTFSAIANQTGLAIQKGQDLRPSEEIQPDWAKNAKAIVARALADEVKHGGLFQRVKIVDEPINPKKYSETVQFRVKKFGCYNRAEFLERMGRDLLRFQGIRGALIAESIPTKYISDIEIEFEVLDPSTGQSVFVKTYSAIRTASLNGYQGEKPKVQQTSAALEAVITQFMEDLEKIPLSRNISR